MSKTPDGPHEQRNDGPVPVPRESGADAETGLRRGSVADREVLVNEIALSSARQLEPDVELIHRPIFREPIDPEEGREPAPWWLWAVAALALFWGGWYLGRHGGTFGADSHVAFRGTNESVRDEAAGQKAAAITDPVAQGQSIYARQCQGCHQPGGMGVPGAFPPLIGSEWVTGSPETVTRILLNGLQNSIIVAGETYNGAMPPWRDALSDAEIAAVGTYIRQWETNRASPISPELVAQLRTATADRGSVPWTADELRQAEALPPTTKEP